MRRWLILALLALVILAAAVIAVFEGVPEPAPGRAAPDVETLAPRRGVVLSRTGDGNEREIVRFDLAPGRRMDLGDFRVR